jgi:hypothetical protein
LKFSTYDPAKGAWQNKSLFEITAITMNGFLIKDGVVVYKFTESNGGPGFKATIYDPQWGYWDPELYAGSNTPLLALSIVNATVHYEFQDFAPDLLGYEQGGWDHTPTTPLAYFVAHPEAGYKPPLWVWFTDMSIGGASWNWVFGDGATGNGRSPNHTFTGAGNFKVVQNLNNNASTFSRTIYIGLKPLPSWGQAYSSMTTSEDLGQLRRYRDEVLNKTTRGNYYRDLLYTHSEEVLEVLLRNPELLIRARGLIETNRGAVAQVLRGEEGVIDNPQEILNFLQAFGEKSPARLRDLTGMVRREMLRKQEEGVPFQRFRLGNRAE